MAAPSIRLPEAVRIGGDQPQTHLASDERPIHPVRPPHDDRATAGRPRISDRRTRRSPRVSAARAARKGQAPAARTPTWSGENPGRGKVNDRSPDCGDRYPVVRGHILRPQDSPAKVDPIHAARPIHRNTYLNARPGRPLKPPMSRRRAVRQHCSGRTGEHRGHPVALGSQDIVPDGEYTTVKPHESVNPNSMLDLIAIQAELNQLPPREHPELALRKPRDPSIRVLYGFFGCLYVYYTHEQPKSRRDAGSPPDLGRCTRTLTRA